MKNDLPNITILLFGPNDSEIIWNYEADPRVIGKQLKNLVSSDQTKQLIKSSITKEVTNNSQNIDFFTDVIDEWNVDQKIKSLPVVKPSEVFH